MASKRRHVEVPHARLEGDKEKKCEQVCAVCVLHNVK